MAFSSGPCIVRIAYLLYKNRLALKQMTVQGFALHHLVIRLSFFTFFTVIGVAFVIPPNLSGERSDPLP